ncbi:glycerol-3-phosphate dehydrogenase/oxidase [Pedobacter sp. MW01-1-1]|uniref:glycerol-3-phosphate dehydrogenase/oxidase n=1 Tax=Pedobacter sp. MW01-1-1 TaxID=3383027 RepID=UPI003FF010F1
MIKRSFTHSSTETEYDIIIIGGGATGLGIAVDAASRNLKVLLVEQSDFAKGTSSRSTKLVHGGVRYLAQGDIKLVKHALKERGLLFQNAPHLVEKEAFIIPCYSWFSVIKYFIGLTIYDWLSGIYSFGKSSYLGRDELITLLPNVKTKSLKGAIRYFDGKFDDARLAINLAQTAVENGAQVYNYTKVIGFLKDKDRIIGIETEDALTGEKAKFFGKLVVNATGVFVDDVLKLNNPNEKPLVRPSQGVHIVLAKHFLKSSSAIMIPKTSDGRVLFAVPWHDHVLVGTTDTPLNEHSLEPVALQTEVDFILKNTSEYLIEQPSHADILSVFSGLRPLAATNNKSASTKEISRDHKLLVSANRLITITGGKWTTYRLMAEDTVDLAIHLAGLTAGPCTTPTLKIHGYSTRKNANPFLYYGSDEAKIDALIMETPALGEKILPEQLYLKAHVIWAIRYEMAETIEDILSRRLRILFLDAACAIKMAPIVASIFATEIGADKLWENKQVADFMKVAKPYLPSQ